MEPWKKPEGIRYVILNGAIAVKEGEPCDLRRGRVLSKN